MTVRTVTALSLSLFVSGLSFSHSWTLGDVVMWPCGDVEDGGLVPFASEVQQHPVADRRGKSRQTPGKLVYCSLCQYQRRSANLVATLLYY